MSESTRQRKLRRTEAARRSLPAISCQAFAKVIKFAKDEDLSDVSSRRADLRDARDFSSEATPYGGSLVEVELVGTPTHPNHTVYMFNPMSYVWLAYTKGGGFYSALNRALLTSPCAHDEPWRLVFYSDEVVSGNPLRMQNTRKVWVIYWGFLEFGGSLSDEDAWCPVVCEASNTLKHVVLEAGGKAERNTSTSEVACKVAKRFNDIRYQEVFQTPKLKLTLTLACRNILYIYIYVFVSRERSIQKADASFLRSVRTTCKDLKLPPKVELKLNLDLKPESFRQKRRPSILLYSL